MEKVASTCICYQVLLSSTESLVCHSVMTRRDGMGEGREARGEGYVCILMADLHCCKAETNTTL